MANPIFPWVPVNLVDGRIAYLQTGATARIIQDPEAPATRCYVNTYAQTDNPLHVATDAASLASALSQGQIPPST